MFSETKIDDRFPIGNFVIDGYSTHCRLDQNSNSGEILLYMREDITSYLTTTEKALIESFYEKLNLHNEKYLLNCSYNTHKTMISNDLATLEKLLNLHSSKYEKILILGNFNIEANKEHAQSF